MPSPTIARTSAVTPADAGARRPGLRSAPAVKLARLALQMARGAWVVGLRFRGLQPAGQHQEIQRWARQVLSILEVTVEVDPSTPLGSISSLLVCNHLSWLDVLVLQSLMPVAFVAKTEVKRWPLVGYMAQACGTIFVNRTSARSAQAMVQDTARQIQGGLSVVVFPEGTSSDGTQVGRFHANIFESAIRANAPVQPLALRYLKANGAPETAPHFTGDMTLLESLQRVSATRGLRACLEWAAPIAPAGHSRKSLAMLAHGSICQQLYGPRDART